MIIKPLKALASLAGTLTHGLRRFAPNFSPCISAPKQGVIHTRNIMYKLLLLFVFLPLSFAANAALSEGELEQLATKFVEAKNARQQPDTTIQDIDAFINLIADAFVDEHVKFNVTITEKSALREGLIAKMNDKIYYSSIVINEMMTGSNVAIIKMTESGKVRPNHLDK